MSSYEHLFGEPCGVTNCITGELVFLRQAPTISVPAKTDSAQTPGVFLDYYIDPDGKFSGQYMVCPLDDFTYKNLHCRIGAAHFHLHIHRTEVNPP